MEESPAFAAFRESVTEEMRARQVATLTERLGEATTVIGAFVDTDPPARRLCAENIWNAAEAFEDDHVAKRVDEIMVQLLEVATKRGMRGASFPSVRLEEPLTDFANKILEAQLDEHDFRYTNKVIQELRRRGMDAYVDESEVVYYTYEEDSPCEPCVPWARNSEGKGKAKGKGKSKGKGKGKSKTLLVEAAGPNRSHVPATGSSGPPWVRSD
eukprot:TRINITY_DN11894_c4_g1_i1.p1 TRINITY_DN11894_c4_g1~~TRINITY_DN11894_c4_g1_i1.p1  ORF type:complete len:213 (+),score=32.65 TRINITY_DN11894_c4_g1_i1:91-729(+)